MYTSVSHRIHLTDRHARAEKIRVGQRENLSYNPSDSNTVGLSLVILCNPLIAAIPLGLHKYTEGIPLVLPWEIVLAWRPINASVAYNPTR